MDIKYLFYTFLCIIAFILVIRFGNSKSILKKEAKFYHKLLRLRLRTRILIIILAWTFSATWIVIAFKYNYKGISILGMGPFVIICCGVVNIPIWEYLRKKIIKSSYSDSIKDWLNFFNALLTAYLVFIEFFVIGFCIILARFLHWI
ncbi:MULTISPECIES: hypothetical protein [Fusobacterium]|uniref:Uncharacterized protein n=3 Tax=Fusobacterium animalis TaxID=76859 RepID=R9RCR3_9FUSO|nr:MULTISPECIES: hypothetical protein [Fusobacterium]EFD80278.1 hypothetical protein PSAG_00313 [Fusobacterium animalis D11]AGM24014.1 hypothetical protein HMPREF0409_00165 [Fusobacterium animalis 4_8]EEW95559.1 hypothetical protein HMPREF0406_00981 [Fusobacterium animalis 3_1_33]EGN65548.1 hypothetical protein HMPREF0404_00466 [Fusobacterium animalis 21_1A]ERT41511.1 hypothetical protein HMPREF1538_01126 [Fusobacterium nucleatum CTI-1]